MILFQSDWVHRHPTAIPHYSTTNRSWVKLAGVYHKMGVENCLFHLALHNPLLQDINPHDPNLSTEQIAMVVEEASENPWYVLREIIRVPPVAGISSVPLRANRGNISLYFLFFNHITLLLIQVRQSGKSLSVDALMVSLLMILSDNTDITLVTKDDSLRVKNVARVKGLIENLPKYLQLRTRKDTNNTEKITVSNLGNTYNTSVAQSSPKAAINLGRGTTTPIVHIDEIAFINNIEYTLPALLPATGSARDSAKEAGAPYGNIFTTTPGYLATKSGEFAYGIYNDSFRWTEALFDCKDIEDLRNMIITNSPSGKLQVLLDFNHRQLGYTDAWLREKISDAMSSGQSAESDFLGIWPAGSGSDLISKENKNAIMSSRIHDPDNMISTYGYIIKWYIPISNISKHTIVAGLDTSEAIGKDGIGLVLRDASTGEVLGSGDFNETNTVTFSRWLAELLIGYPNITLIIERKSTGISIIDGVIEILVHKRVDPFARLFNWVVNDARVKEAYKNEVINVPMSRRDPEVYIKYRKFFGYATSGVGRSSREVLYGEIFNAAISYTSDSVRDTKLANQLTGLKIKNNRIDHSEKGHDDLVIGWLLSYWMLSKGENLDFYGIPVNKVLSKITEQIVMENGGHEAIEAKEYQLDLKSEIDDLVESIKKEKSAIKIITMVNRLKYLYRDIDTSIIQVHNLSTLIDSLELDKKKSNIVNSYTRY